MVKALERLCKSIEKWLTNFAEWCLYIGTGMVAFEIASRTIFGLSYDITIEFPTWIMVWVAVLLGGPLFKHEGHVSFDLLLKRLKGQAVLRAKICNILATLAYAVLLTVGSFKAVQTMFKLKLILPKALDIPTYIPHLCMPIGMSLLCFYCLQQLLVEIARVFEAYNGEEDILSERED